MSDSTPPHAVSVNRGRLTPEQTARFRHTGYLIYDQPVFPLAKFQALKDHFEQKLVDWERTAGQSPEHMDTPHFT
ncbi:MAG: hypothetical protein ACOC9P_00435, partial [bacterium]